MENKVLSDKNWLKEIQKPYPMKKKQFNYYLKLWSKIVKNL